MRTKQRHRFRLQHVVTPCVPSWQNFSGLLGRSHACSGLLARPGPVSTPNECNIPAVLLAHFSFSIISLCSHSAEPTRIPKPTLLNLPSRTRRRRRRHQNHHRRHQNRHRHRCRAPRRILQQPAASGIVQQIILSEIPSNSAICVTRTAPAAAPPKPPPPPPPKPG